MGFQAKIKLSDFLVIFDCDGVLVDSEDVAMRVEAEAFTQIGIPMTAQDIFNNFVGKSDQQVEEIILQKYGITLPDLFCKTMEDKLRSALAKEVCSIGGVQTILESIPNKALASNGALSKIHTSLNTTGLNAFFTDKNIFSAEMVSKGKPSPELYFFTAQTMGFSPEKCFVVEDSLSGVKAGVAAKMYTIGFVGGSHIHDKKSHGQKLLDLGAKYIVEDMLSLYSVINDGVSEAVMQLN